VRKRSLLERLAEAERQAAAADERARRADAEATRLREAIEALPYAMVVCDPSGKVVLRNRRSADLEGGRHAAALIDRAVEEVVAAAAGTGRSPGSSSCAGPRPGPCR